MNCPVFKYHPNILENKNVIHDKGICQCCGKQVEIFIDSMYCEKEIACICLNCVADGSAAAKFDGSFVQDAMRVSDKKKTEELFLRTPGYRSWQGEYWLACCDDYCEYLGTVGLAELESLGIEDEVISEYESKKGITIDKKYLTKSGTMVGYLFRCLHCKRYHLWIDMS
ncbi:MAG: CbrC family protein [Lachnospiraceae bacterium]|nr:CbrC family protein [Lachnospiraceae bacterium]